MKTVILDRDGVINQNPLNKGYVRDWNDFIFLPNALDAIRILTQNGYGIIVATNQAGIGKGLYSEKKLSEIHQQMLNVIEEEDGEIRKIYYCPHHPDAKCGCRKPNPGMLLQAAEENKLVLSKTFFIGDSFTDIQAARNAGALPILVLTGHGRETYKQYIKADSTVKDYTPEKIFTSLYSAARWMTMTKN
ncbi:MAG: D-glycero-beta-D-manno-heptose 1,7-bisphosphate 7-phosphatase [Candidatus Poribacteria bacterium]|nr:D-glycero-beta-D-manno-heptose 1,7-bisphosphate 7-phosphatase [Candidatus Poribacteria bacterium]